MDILSRFLDKDGRVVFWPAKHKKVEIVLLYISSKIENQRFYNEKEINALLEQWVLANDPLTIRRALVDHKYLCRKNNGSLYWKPCTESNEGDRVE